MVGNMPETHNNKFEENKKVFIKTYGCQMNVYDSQRMEDQLNTQGYDHTDNIEEADLILLNTCHIREKAAEKLYSDLGRLRVLRKQKNQSGKDFILGVTGCVAQAEGEEIISRAPVVDLVIGPQTYQRLPEALDTVRNGKKFIDTQYAAEEKFKSLKNVNKQLIKKRGVTAFVTVQEGCDKFCTFCVVPYTRGVEISRPISQIITETEALVAQGVREITLLGQNVNAWHAKDEKGTLYNLGDLLYRLAEIEGLARLRYTTSHPLDMDDSLIKAHANIKKLMPYLHLPIQSGSDKMLKSMNRRHTAAQYKELIAKMREACPDLALSGDFIVGFPGETDKCFEDTLNLVKDVFYASAYSFKYSPRIGTPGADMAEQVPESVKDERLQILQKLLLEQQYSFQNSKVGCNVEILLEKAGRHENQLVGRSPWLLPVVVETQQEIGSLLNVKITERRGNSLLAQSLEMAPAI